MTTNAVVFSCYCCLTTASCDGWRREASLLKEGNSERKIKKIVREKRKEDWGLRRPLYEGGSRCVGTVVNNMRSLLLITLYVVFVVVATRLTEVNSLPSSLLLTSHHRHHHSRATFVVPSSLTPSSIVLPRIINSSTCTLSKSVITRCSLSKDPKESEQAINTNTNNNNFKGIRDPNERYENNFGPLLPIAEAVDTFSNGWGLSYADLRPVTPRTPVGIAFLLTNLLYNAAGIYLLTNGDIFYGTLMELAGIVSFVYHYTQLELGKDRSEVRLALLIDYFFAGSALLTGTFYMIAVGFGAIPVEALTSAVGAVICLSLCWVWEYGYPYILWHSLWHILSAYTGYLVGLVHLSNV